MTNFIFRKKISEIFCQSFNGINVNRTKVEDEIFPDPKDIVFYEVAMSKEDAFLVTGNIRHFPSKPFVVTPAQMMEIIT